MSADKQVRTPKFVYAKWPGGVVDLTDTKNLTPIWRRRGGYQ